MIDQETSSKGKRLRGTAELSGAEDLIADASRGKMVILVDDEDRENEGDLVIPAECADARAIAFMAREACGLICLALPAERVDMLGLPLMHAFNGTRHETAFTISIEAREGVTTGISAADRARTIAVAIDPNTRSDDLVSPGHVFPLRARSGGVLVRAGHTEAAVDLARLGGRTPAGVICEIMKEDGTMARLPDLLAFAARHDLRIGTIADLIAHRRRTETLVRTVLTRELDGLPAGRWMAHVFADVNHGTEHLAMVYGDLSGTTPLVWIHHESLQDHLDPSRGLKAAMLAIAERGAGAVVLIREQERVSLARQIATLKSPDSGEAKFRDYGLGLQILKALGIEEFRLLRDSVPDMPALSGHHVKVT